MIWESITVGVLILVLFWIIITRKDKKNLNKLRSNYKNEDRREPSGRESGAKPEPSEGTIRDDFSAREL